jgi:hypothetical protein
MGRYRGEDVATVEGVGDGMQVKALFGEITGSRDATK